MTLPLGETFPRGFSVVPKLAGIGFVWSAFIVSVRAVGVRLVPLVWRRCVVVNKVTGAVMNAAMVEVEILSRYTAERD